VFSVFYSALYLVAGFGFVSQAQLLACALVALLPSILWNLVVRVKLMQVVRNRQ
jgi:hypothetical protein